VKLRETTRDEKPEASHPAITHSHLSPLTPLALSVLLQSALNSPYNKTSDVFSPEYKANTSRRIDFSADVITNTSSNIRLYTAFAMHIVGICPNITQFTVLTY